VSGFVISLGRPNHVQETMLSMESLLNEVIKSMESLGQIVLDEIYHEIFCCYGSWRGTGIAQWYRAGLWAEWSGVRIPTGAGNLYHPIQAGSGAHPASYPMGTMGSFPGGKAPGIVKLTTHLHLVPRLIMRGAIPPLPQYVFMAWCLVKHKENFTCTFYILWQLNT
jgi:hypothetical protein